MERLPFVDEHRVHVRAPPERAWEAVSRFVSRRLESPAPSAFRALWRLEPASGFARAAERRPSELVLRGRHRFARYELAFVIEREPDGASIAARTSAVFPGIAGRVYRALVIGSGGHRVVVRRFLRQIAAD
jgi:hypothetical protein